jgi:hypothetical protein
MKTLTKTSISFHYLITFLIISFGSTCSGQDTIITRNGQSILGHVMEVSTTEIKYKKAGIADGPVYIEDKSGVARINYKNGFSDVFPEIKPWQLPIAKVEKKEEVVNFKRKPVLEKRRGKYLYDNERLGENELHKLLLAVNDPDIDLQVRKAKRSRGLQYVGFAAIPFTVVAALASLTIGETGLQRSEDIASGVFLGCAAISVGTSYYFKINRKKRNAEAVRLYKQKFE